MGWMKLNSQKDEIIQILIGDGRVIKIKVLNSNNNPINNIKICIDAPRDIEIARVNELWEGSRS